MHLLIAHPLAPDIAARIAERRPRLDVRARHLRDVTPEDLAWAEALVGFRRPRAGLGAVRWVHSIGAGVDSWLAEPWPSGVLLTRTTQSFAAPIGEWVLARLLAVTQELRRLEADRAARRWDEFTPRLLTGTRAVVVGTGDVGRGIAERLAALGVEVTGVSRSGRPAGGFARVRKVSLLPELVGGCDWLVLAAPLTLETRGMVDDALLARLSGAWLVNVGRGGLVDEAAMLRALEAGQLAGAALDVFATEPLPQDSPIWTHPRILLSPHIAGVTTVEGAADGFIETLDALDRGALPPRPVDPDTGY